MENPRVKILIDELNRTVLKPFQAHGWIAEISKIDKSHDSVEIRAEKKERKVCFGVVYSSASNYRHFSSDVEHIFYSGMPYRVEEFTRNIAVPVESLGDFFPYLIKLNKEVDPDKTPSAKIHKEKEILRITAENPLAGIHSHLEQYTSVLLAKKLIADRAEFDGYELAQDVIDTKAGGVSFTLRNALDYFESLKNERLNKRILSLYYGVMAFASAEMLSAPHGSSDLESVEEMTKYGHGLFTVTPQNAGFGELMIGVIATGFFPQWLSFLGYDVLNFPTRKAKSINDFEKINPTMFCSLKELFASIQEIEQLFSLVFPDVTQNWIIPYYDTFQNNNSSLFGSAKKAESTYISFFDPSGKISIESLCNAGWPIAEVSDAENNEGFGRLFRARVDHVGHELWWGVMPVNSSPFNHDHSLIFPTIAGITEYRVIVTVILYALSILVRYMPSTWRKIENGDDDRYLALIKASLDVWERMLPEHFLESITNMRIHAKQPGSFF